MTLAQTYQDRALPSMVTSIAHAMVACATGTRLTVPAYRAIRILVEPSFHWTPPRPDNRECDMIGRVSVHPKKFASVLAVLNLKGGVGKTHATWLLASVCHEREHRVLLIDLDTQGNLSNSFLDPTNHQPGVEKIFHPGNDTDITRLIRTTAFSHIDVIPCGPALAPLDLSNQTEWEKADLHLSLVDTIATLKDRYDYVVFDCPPRLSLVSFAALCASDGVVIPMEAADWGAQGIMQVTAAIEYVEKHFNERLRLLGYVVSRFKRARAYQQSYLYQLREHFGPKAFDTVLPDLAAFEKSVTDRIPITLHARRSIAAGIARQFFDEVERRAKVVASFRRRRGIQSVQSVATAAR